MPRGPRGERRPADVVGCAVHVVKIATGEIEDTKDENENKKTEPLKEIPVPAAAE